MRRGLEEWSLNDACHSHQHEAAPGWADWYVGRWENTEKDVLFKKQVWGPHGGASQGSRDSKSRWLESFTRDFFQANRSKGSGPACLSAPSCFQHLFQTSLPSKDLDHTPLISPGNFTSYCTENRSLPTRATSTSCPRAGPAGCVPLCRWRGAAPRPTPPRRGDLCTRPGSLHAPASSLTPSSLSLSAAFFLSTHTSTSLF